MYGSIRRRGWGRVVGDREGEGEEKVCGNYR